MVDTHQTRRRLLQTAGVAIGSSIVVGTASADHEETWTFHADLTGEGHGIETNANGRATFEIPPDDHRIHYTIDVEWLCYGTQAHIHLGEEGEDGPVVAWLYPEEGQEPQTIEGRFDGTLAEGSLTADDLVGPLEGADAGEIVSALIEGDAYVNVHTEEHPGGEIRGQIRPDDETAELIEEAREESGEAEAEGGDETGDEEEGDGSEGQGEDSDNGTEEEDGDDEAEDEADGEGGSDDSEEDGDGEEEEPADGDDEEETADPSGALQVVEVNVLGDDPADENIVFENTSNQDLDLTGFEVYDAEGGAVENRNTPEGPFVFGDLVLEAGATVTLHSGEGSDDDENVYWDQTGQQVWNQTGDTVRVFSPEGELVLEHEFGDQTTSSIGTFFNTVRALFA